MSRHGVVTVGLMWVMGSLGAAEDGADAPEVRVDVGSDQASPAPDVDSGARVARRFTIRAPEGEAGGWLGVNIAAVPAVVRAQVVIPEGQGILVANVVKGSPADEAGLRQHDVILSLDGQALAAGPEGFAEAVRGKNPGDEARLEVLRRGEKLSLTVKIAKPSGPVVYKFEPDIEDYVEDGLKVRRHVVRRGPDGAFVFELAPDGHGRFRLGAGPDHRPGSAGAQVEIRKSVENGKSVSSIRRVVGKETVEVEERVEGKTTAIVVSRTTRPEGGGEEVETTEYSSADELKKADEDAWGLLRQLREGKATVGDSDVQARVFSLLDPRMGAGGVAGQSFPRTPEEMEEWLEKLRSGFDAFDAQRKAIELGSQGVFDRWAPQWAPRALRKAGASGAKASATRRQFRVDEAGRIRVSIEKDGSSVETSFKSEDEMLEKAPELHAHYKELLGAK